MIWRAKFPTIKAEHEDGGNHGHFPELFQHPRFLWAVLAQLMYVGAQFGTWSYFIQYVQDSTHQPEKIGGYFLTGTLAAFALGRFISAYLMGFVAPSKLLGIYALMNVMLVAIGVFLPGWVGLWAMFRTSFFMPLMFPTIFTLGLKGLGPKIGGSLLVRAIIGRAVFTLAKGFISEALPNLAWAYCLPLSSYIFIAYYPFVTSRIEVAT